MRALSLAAAGLVFIAGCGVASAAQPYEGFWASTQKDCSDKDSANRMSIEGGNRLYWYETRCRAGDIKPDGDRAWKMRLSCEGEGEKFKSSPQVSIATDGKLVIDNAQLPGIPEKGPIALQHHGDPVEFGNLYIRELK